jgi:hypothetical protein
MAQFVGAPGEIAVDLSYMRTVLHDGVTEGGWPQERAGLTLVNDVNYTVLPTDTIVMYTAKTAARTVTLPALASFPQGQRLLILDGAGNSTTFNITVNTATSTENIRTSTFVLINTSTASAYGRLLLFSNLSTGSWVTA